MTKGNIKFFIALMTILIMSIVSFMFMGCNNEDEFTEVSSVTFTSGGQTRTVYSSWYISTGNYEVATKDEYNKAEFKTSVMTPNTVDIYTISAYTSDCFSGNIYNINTKPYKPHNISTDDIGKYFYIYAHDLGEYTTSYYKVEIKGVGAVYAQVKVIDNTTIIVKKGATETTYTVTSYSLKK